MSEKVLITPTELLTLTNNEPAVLIDTRDPATYAAGHLPGAVNIHDIFTYLATSTPEGVAAMRDKFASNFGAAGLSGLPQGQDFARRLRRLDRRRLVDIHRDAEARAKDLPGRSERGGHIGRSAEHESRCCGPKHRQARHPRCGRMDRRLFLALRQGLLSSQGAHSRRGLARMVPHDEADPERADIQIKRGNPCRMRHRRHYP